MTERHKRLWRPSDLAETEREYDGILGDCLRRPELERFLRQTSTVEFAHCFDRERRVLRYRLELECGWWAELFRRRWYGASGGEISRIPVFDSKRRRRLVLSEMTLNGRRFLINVEVCRFFSYGHFIKGIYEIKDAYGLRMWSKPILLFESDYGWHAKSSPVAEAWLDENYPRWRDPFAYWDEL